MTFMNWLPELSIFVQLFILLACMNFKPVSHRSIPLVCAVLSALTLGYFGFRSDLAFFDSPARVLLSDSLSLFGRMFALLFLSMGALNLHLHRHLSFGAKQRATLFMLFFSLFLCGIFEANSIVLFVVCWVGAYIAMTKLVLIESKLSDTWIRAVRQRAIPLSVILSLSLLLFLITANASGSIYISDFIDWIKHAHSVQPALAATGGLIVVLGALLVHGMVLQGPAPIALSMLNLFLWCSASVFWFRIGVPFLSESGVLPKSMAQLFLGSIFALFSLRYAIQALRTQDSVRWLSAFYPASIGMGLFLLVLGVDQAMPMFYVLSVAFLFTFFFAGHAFLETEYRNKIPILFSLLALVGIPPLILGDEYYRLVRGTYQAGLLPISIGLGIVWLVLSISTIQMFAKVILIKNGRATYRKILSDEMICMGVYTVCVIALTALRPALIALLNDHPLPYLW